MCGIFAIQQKGAIEVKRVQASLSLINHRGPEDKRIECVNTKDGQVGLGHARLKVTGLDSGSQPLYNEDKTIWAVVNGEFYDFESIRETLKKSGHSFVTETDSEILVHLYEAYGEKCIDFLHGEFAFALYDKKKDAWLLGRDRFGIKPLNWVFEHGRLMVSSEAKAFKPWMPLCLDKDALWFSQNFQYLPMGKTLFKSVNLVKPGHFVTVDIKNSSVKEVNYHKLATPFIESKDDLKTATEKVGVLLEKAVERRIPKEVSFCAHLSGGLDSSSICAIAKDYGLKDAFTISFKEDKFYDEGVFAQETADFLGIHLNVVDVTFADLLDNIAKATYHAEGLSINGHLSGKYLLNQAIKNAGYKVALSGEGSDEIFMGYSHLKQDFLGKNDVSTMEKKYLGGFQLPDGEMNDLTDVENQFGFVPTWLMAKSSMAKKFEPMWSDDFKLKMAPNHVLIKDMQDMFHSHVGLSKMKQSAVAWSNYCLSGYILKVLDDAQSMAFAVEGRLPFLDTDLARYALSLPDAHYFNGNQEKQILRNLMLGKLPNTILQKTKQSFMSSPLTNALKTPKYYEQVRAMLTQERFINQQVFDQEAVMRHLDLWRVSNTPVNEPILMTLLCLSQLCETMELS